MRPTLPNLDKIVFFDGVCVLCNGIVKSLIKMDKKKVLRYSSLQSEFAKTVLHTGDFDPPSSVIFYNQGIAFKKHKAVAEILKCLKGPYKFLGFLLSLIPSFIGGHAYDLIAKYRYRIFGKNDTCFIPNQSEKNLFII